MRVTSLFLALSRWVGPLAIGATGLGLVAAPAVALAQDANAAEKLRLEEEMKKLAGKNAWTGVERNYEALEALKLPLSFDDYFLGAQAARYLGKTYEQYSRLELAKKLDSRPEILQEIEAIDSSYVRVELQGFEKRLVFVKPMVMPFAPDQRKSIEWSSTVTSNTGSFRGMLPPGEYVVVPSPETPLDDPDAFHFTLEQGSDPQQWRVIELSKKISKGTGVEYAGPVAVAGYNFGTSAAPTTLASNEVQPASITGSGLSLQVGGELGFNKMVGTAVTLGYDNYFGNHVGHGFTGWAALVLRPADARIAIGPTWGILATSGTGLAQDVGSTSDALTAANMTYKGLSQMAGVQLSAGYGVVDLSPLMLLVEADGAWRTDGNRSFINAGLRIGIAPKVERFKE